MISDYERVDLLWDEYKYRHEHCWKLLFQITAAVVIISVFPYTVNRLPKDIIMALPGITIGLIIFSISRVYKELCLWQALRIKHMEFQEHFNIVKHKYKKETFKRDVLIYLSLLLALALINAFFVWTGRF